jgi:hypothetical protein
MAPPGSTNRIIIHQKYRRDESRNSKQAERRSVIAFARLESEIRIAFGDSIKMSSVLKNKALENNQLTE